VKTPPVLRTLEMDNPGIFRWALLGSLIGGAAAYLQGFGFVILIGGLIGGLISIAMQMQRIAKALEESNRLQSRRCQDEGEYEVPGREE
jgi:hypothetical protein